MRTLLITGLLVIFTASCSVQDRHYRTGLTIHWKKTAGRENRQLTRSQAAPHAPAALPAAADQASPLLAGASPKEQELAPGTASRLNLLSPPDTCDELFLRSGERLKARVIEVGPSVVKYRKCDFPGGPIYSTYKKDLTVVLYANGSHETFTTEPLPPPPGNLTKKDRPRGYTDAKELRRDALFSFLFGLLGIVIIYYGSIHAIVLGLRVLRVMRANPGIHDGKGFAVAGVVLGVVKLALLLLFILASTDIFSYLI